MAILNQLWSKKFIDSILRSRLMFLRNARRSNPVEREIWRRSAVLSYTNKTYLRVIDIFPGTEPESFERLLASFAPMIKQHWMLDIGDSDGICAIVDCGRLHFFDEQTLAFRARCNFKNRLQSSIAYEASK